MTPLSRRSLIATGLAAGASSALGIPARAQNLPTLRIAYEPYQYSAQVLYAQEMGFFTKAGLVADLQSIAFGSELASAVTSGAVDIGIAPIATLALAHHKNIPFVCIASAAAFSAKDKPKALLVVGKQTSIHTGKDMNGKTVGTPGLATMGEYGVRAWVDANGGDSSTLKFVELPFSQMAPAFATGRIDMASIGEPYLTGVLKVARALPTSMEAVLGSDYLITAWFAMAPWAAAHPDLVARFNAAVRDAGYWAAKNPARCIEILARTFHQDPASIDPALLARFPGKLTPAGVRPEIAVTARYAGFPPFPPEELIYTTHEPL
jgi:ABC-type nitrate/sulfonate/bicarbonate transport system substrate-binding protein